MQDPVLRVLTTLELLQARDRVTGAELAERLEVDLRTVQRYIVRLRELNIPWRLHRESGDRTACVQGFAYRRCCLQTKKRLLFRSACERCGRLVLRRLPRQRRGYFQSLAECCPWPCAQVWRLWRTLLRLNQSPGWCLFRRQV